MQHISARDAKNGFGRLIDLARAAPVAVDNIASLELPVPPVEVQGKICSFLDSETAEIHTLIEAKQKLLGLLAEKRRTLVAEAVRRARASPCCSP